MNQARIPLLWRQLRERIQLLNQHPDSRPGVAIRWTAVAVMVGWQAELGDPRSMVHSWLPTVDVHRVIRRPAC